jgi:hypothetical protein
MIHFAICWLNQYLYSYKEKENPVNSHDRRRPIIATRGGLCCDKRRFASHACHNRIFNYPIYAGTPPLPSLPRTGGWTTGGSVNSGSLIGVSGIAFKRPGRVSPLITLMISSLSNVSYCTRAVANRSASQSTAFSLSPWPPQPISVPHCR